MPGMPPTSTPGKQVSSIAPLVPVSFADWDQRGNGTRTLSSLYPGRRMLSACLPWAGMFCAFSASAATRQYNARSAKCGQVIIMDASQSPASKLSTTGPRCPRRPSPWSRKSPRSNPWDHASCVCESSPQCAQSPSRPMVPVVL
jgi:hypothetical protein